MEPSDFTPRGSTALIDAVCKTINEHKKDVKSDEKALVLVITDGGENASKEYNAKQMRDLIQGLEQKNWTFTYIGANQDSWQTTKDWGFRQGNVSNYTASAAGTAQTFHTMSLNTRSFAASGSTRTDSFYSEGVKPKEDDEQLPKKTTV
jgi:hypothetical protein